MNKIEYLRELRQQLKRLPSAEVEEIIADYQEHFNIGQKSNKTEDEISRSLGNPRLAAQGYLVNSLMSEANSSSSVLTSAKVLLRAMLLVFILAPFNFLVMAGPALILVLLVLIGWFLPIAASGISVFITGTFLMSGGVSSMGVLPGLSLLFMFLGILGLATLFALVMFLLSKWITRLAALYLHWNINFITSRSF